MADQTEGGIKLPGEARGPLLYVASRASVPERPAMWRGLRDDLGWRIVSSWIDEAGEGETADMSELWARIDVEVRACDGLILYAEPGDFPLKGALVEVGIAIGTGKPVAVVLRDQSGLESRSLRPLGSWANHPDCRLFGSLDAAKGWIAGQCGRAPAAPVNRGRAIGEVTNLLGQVEMLKADLKAEKRESDRLREEVAKLKKENEKLWANQLSGSPPTDETTLRKAATELCEVIRDDAQSLLRIDFARAWLNLELVLRTGKEL